MTKSFALCTSAVALALVAACTKPPAGLTPRPEPVNTDSIARTRADSIARADSIRLAMEQQQREADSLRAIRDAEQRAAAQAANAMNVLLATVYFDYDQSTLTDAARALIDAKVPVLRARPTLRIVITGHTDDRGSTEYNMALGLRRAGEVRDYLIASGIDGSRIETNSMGEERPAVAGEGEEAWSQNRRAEFATLGGA
jgi:peptidoglycan-associated lipoprotein